MITARSFWYWFGGIWFAIGVLFVTVSAVVGVNRASLDERFAAQGAAAEGVVLTKEITSSNDGATGHRITFRFVTQSGETVRGDADVASAAWDGLVERGPIAVTYLRDRPATYRVPGQRNDDAVVAYAFGAIGAVLGIVGAFVLLRARARDRQRRDLMRSGALANATVVELGPGRLRINGIPQWRIRYRFSDASGRSHDGSCDLSPDEAKRWAEGAAGRVRYDTRNPRSHVWIGKT